LARYNIHSRQSIRIRHIFYVINRDTLQYPQYHTIHANNLEGFGPAGPYFFWLTIYSGVD